MQEENVKRPKRLNVSLKKRDKMFLLLNKHSLKLKQLRQKPKRLKNWKKN
jgi:hypothetical protein